MAKTPEQHFYCLQNPEGIIDVRTFSLTQGICEDYAYNLHVMSEENKEETMKRLRHMGYKFKGPCRLEDVK